METTVDKLEAMFLKSEADLEYIEKRLKLDFINRTAENGCSAEENPALMLENLRALKAKHTALCSEVKEITAAQKESMESIKNNLGNVMKLIQHLQQTTDVKPAPSSSPGFRDAVMLLQVIKKQMVEPLTKSEQDAAENLASALSQTTTEQKFSVPSLLHQGSQ